MEFFKLFLESGLFLDEIRHGAVSACFSIFLYRKTKNIYLSIVPILVTYTIDFDHLFDYFMYYGFKFNAVDYIRMDYFRKTGQAVVPLHAWEWVLGLSYFAYLRRKWDSWQAVLSLGVISHLIWDSYTVGNPVFYSILYRAVHSFVIL